MKKSTAKKPVLAWSWQLPNGKIVAESFVEKNQAIEYFSEYGYDGNVVRVQVSAYKPKKK